MQSNKFKSNAKERKNIIAKLARVKKIVKFMLMNVGSHPGKKPSEPKQLAEWQMNLLKLGRQAENNIYAHCEKSGKSTPFDKFNVSSVLTNNNACKQMQQDLVLPRDTPCFPNLRYFKINHAHPLDWIDEDSS
jgi:hypothetical protein